ncbi:uncharacterized protein LOC125303610 [Alosa alosa]|uniref:uncharacterized protein LOC125303610 n=1 Tax=Alosa alosa TaxID=278164 RepID=UPI0020150985|nr:uncharacterized protein LOC125303610 [Alosa alosa]
MMAAPLSMAACRRRLFRLFVLALLVSSYVHVVQGVIVYDRQTLLNIRASIVDLTLNAEDGNTHSCLLPCLPRLPGEVWAPRCDGHCKRRPRRRSKRAGALVKLRSLARSNSGFPDHQPSQLNDDGPDRRSHYVHRRSLEPRYTALHPLTPVTNLEALTPPACPRLRVKRGRANLLNLRPLVWMPSPSVCGPAIAPDPVEVKMALINANHISNKTFILNDFTINNGLDFLLVTEAWLNTGEFAPLVEMCPSGFDFLSTPRSSGQGGGLAALFRNTFNCRVINCDQFSSFEVQLMLLDMDIPLLIALVYRPPSSKKFISQFSDFLSNIMSKHERTLILGDFNIHVCCPSKPMVSDFIQLIDSFGFVQHVTGPTHRLGHTLDLVLTSGVPVSIQHSVSSQLPLG